MKKWHHVINHKFKVTPAYRVLSKLPYITVRPFEKHFLSFDVLQD